MKKIKLRALTSTDVDKTLTWHNEALISDLYLGHPFPVNIEMERKWYDKILTSNFPTTVFGIEYIENKTLIGITLLKDIDMINRSAELAIYIGDTEYKGKGLSKEATQDTYKFGFFKLGLNRITARVLSENKTSITMFEKVGFKTEGIMRQVLYKNNEFKNVLLMSILKQDVDGNF